MKTGPETVARAKGFRRCVILGVRQNTNPLYEG